MSDSLPKLEAQIKELTELVQDIEIVKEGDRLSSNSRQPSGNIRLSKRAKSEPIIGKALSVKKTQMSFRIFQRDQSRQCQEMFFLGYESLPLL